ncbi:unnamed protein product [Orchesella dallaii]|uniref:Uncharacterized protein n=1 Tax=Orchesella dallaii TaxID=48710 RepID=A0ABP1SAC2_9HEXA
MKSVSVALLALLVSGAWTQQPLPTNHSDLTLPTWQQIKSQSIVHYAAMLKPVELDHTQLDEGTRRRRASGNGYGGYADGTDYFGYAAITVVVAEAETSESESDFGLSNLKRVRVESKLNFRGDHGVQVSMLDLLRRRRGYGGYEDETDQQGDAAIFP